MNVKQELFELRAGLEGGSNSSNSFAFQYFLSNASLAKQPNMAMIPRSTNIGLVFKVKKDGWFGANTFVTASLLTI